MAPIDMKTTRKLSTNERDTEAAENQTQYIERMPAASSKSQTSPSEEAVRTRAYYKWEAAGRPNDDSSNFWLDAEQELRQQRS